MTSLSVATRSRLGLSLAIGSLPGAMVYGILGYAHAAFRRARRMNRDLRGRPLTIAICRNESASRSKEMPKNRLIDTAALRR